MPMASNSMRDLAAFLIVTALLILGSSQNLPKIVR